MSTGNERAKAWSLACLDIEELTDKLWSRMNVDGTIIGIQGADSDLTELILAAQSLADILKKAREEG